MTLTACNNEESKTEDAKTKAPAFVEENVTYTDGSITMNGLVVYDSSVSGKRPGILVVPEWWGISDYSRSRARQLAGLGYIALAVDLYGDGKLAATPDSAMALAGPFYKDPMLAKSRFEAAMAKLKSYAQTDSTKLAAIGYCFGGTQVINMAKLGEDLKGVVSFHGGLATLPANKDLLKSELLVLNGGADSLVPAADIARFRKGMDSIGAKYTFKSFDGALHAFTNPASTANGKKFNMPIAYNPAADTASWKDMRDFFDRVLK